MILTDTIENVTSDILRKLEVAIYIHYKKQFAMGIYLIWSASNTQTALSDSDMDGTVSRRL